MPATANRDKQSSAHRGVRATPSLVTVVMPVRNEEPYIGRTLQQLLDQNRDGIQVEIFVLDGRSTDRTREIVAEYARRHGEIQLLDNPRQLSSAARNIAIRQSQADYIVIVDGHCEIRSDSYFLDLVDAFERSGADCLGRPQPLDVSHATTLQRAIAAARSSRLGHHPDSFIYSSDEVDCPAGSVAIAYRRSVFDQVGLFDERFDACEDYELNHRIDQAGMRCRLIPKLSIFYEPRKSISGLFRQLFRYGRGRVRMSRKHKMRLSWSTLAPAALVLGAIVGPLSCLIVPALWPFYLSVIAFYMMVTTIESLRLAVVLKDIWILPWLPIVFWAIHFGSGFGLLWELCAGARRLA